jgi:hypothetical protein
LVRPPLQDNGAQKSYTVSAVVILTDTAPSGGSPADKAMLNEQPLRIPTEHTRPESIWLHRREGALKPHVDTAVGPAETYGAAKAKLDEVGVAGKVCHFVVTAGRTSAAASWLHWPAQARLRQREPAAAAACASHGHARSTAALQLEEALAPKTHLLLPICQLKSISSGHTRNEISVKSTSPAGRGPTKKACSAMAMNRKW